MVDNKIGYDIVFKSKRVGLEAAIPLRVEKIAFALYSLCPTGVIRVHTANKSSVLAKAPLA